MTVKEVVKLAAENLGRQDLSQMIDAQEEVSEEVVSLLRCFNLVENEVALDYFPPEKGGNVFARFQPRTLYCICFRAGGYSRREGRFGKRRRI